MPHDMLENPIIAGMADGLPEGKDYACPICGEETDTYYVGPYGVVVGCDRCLSQCAPWDYDQFMMS